MQVGDHLGGRGKGWGMQQVQCISYSTFGKALPLFHKQGFIRGYLKNLTPFPDLSDLLLPTSLGTCTFRNEKGRGC